LQTERAYQKQEGVFQNSKNALLKKTKTGRWVKSIGLGYKIPVEVSAKDIGGGKKF